MFDCPVKAKDGSIYYGIIFWQSPPPTKNSKGTSFYKKKAFFQVYIVSGTLCNYLYHCMIVCLNLAAGHNIMVYYFEPLPLKKSKGTSFYENNHFTLLIAVCYDCLAKARDESIYYGIIFWQTPPNNSKGTSFDGNAFFLVYIISIIVLWLPTQS